MQEYKRLFIGVKVNVEPTLEKYITSLKDIFYDSVIKWVHFDNFHLTLKFLGKTESAKLEKISIELSEIAKQMEPFNLRIEGTGVFKDFFRPQVLWMGLKDCFDFEVLKTEIENAMSGLDFEIDHKRFKPHMTIGRIKKIERRDEFEKYVTKYNTTKFQLIKVEEINLYESILDPKGPTYIELEKFKLGKMEGSIEMDRF